MEIAALDGRVWGRRASDSQRTGWRLVCAGDLSRERPARPLRMSEPWSHCSSSTATRSSSSASRSRGRRCCSPRPLLAQRGLFRLPVVIAIAVAANTLADQVYFQLARQRGRAWLERRFGQHPRYQQLIDLVGRRGFLLLVAQPLRLRPAHRDPRGLRRPRHGRRRLHAARPARRPRVGGPDGAPRLLRRRRARPAARGRAALRGGRSRWCSWSRSPRWFGVRHARRAVRWRELRVRRPAGAVARGRAVRGRPDGRAEPALGDLAARAAGRCASSSSGCRSR